MVRGSQPAVFLAKTSVSWQGAFSYMHQCSAPSLLCPKTSLLQEVEWGELGWQERAPAGRAPALVSISLTVLKDASLARALLSSALVQS